MNTKTKGSRNERRTRGLLEADSYQWIKPVARSAPGREL